MSGLRSTSNVRSGADALWAGWASRARPRRPQACCEADLRSGLGRADLIDQASVRVIVGEPPRTVEDREPAVRVFVNAHVRLDEVAAVTLLGDLQHAAAVTDRVVVPHHARHAGDLGPGLEGLGPGGSVLGGGAVIAAEVEQVIDLVVSGEEALSLAG